MGKLGSVQGEYVSETEHALCIFQDPNQIWIPKSLCEYKRTEGVDATLHVPLWWLQKQPLNSIDWDDL